MQNFCATFLASETSGGQRIVCEDVDFVRFATPLSVPLTTIQQPCRDIAFTAFNAMRERITAPTIPARSLLLTPSLIIRESCGAYLAR